MPDCTARLQRALDASCQVCDADVLEELSTHAGAEYDVLCAHGCDPSEAERRVDDLIDVWVRDAASLRRRPKRAPAVLPPGIGRAPLAGLVQDLRYGVRLLRRQPGFAAIAILTMALGIGATTMLFTVAYGVLLKPLPWPDADRLVRVTETRQGRTGRVVGTVSNGTFLAWRDHPSTIEDVGGWIASTATLTGAGDPVRVAIIQSTPNLFAILQARPLIGRLFREGEGAGGQPGLVILSYGLWQERFGGRAEIVTHVVQFDAKPLHSCRCYATRVRVS